MELALIKHNGNGQLTEKQIKSIMSRVRGMWPVVIEYLLEELDDD